jgi:glycosyltransferase involved in cell wall biosynthesis
MVVPESFFDHPDVTWINNNIWGRLHRSKEVTIRIHRLSECINDALYEFSDKFSIDYFIVENALAIPMNIPLGLAITEFLAETGMPAISHNHDFYWERSRFLVNSVQDYLDMAFPPSLPNIQHVVINSAGRDELAWRKGLSSMLIPNVLDFENPNRYPKKNRKRIQAIRKSLGFSPDDIIVLQPTRVVPRKGIEHAVNIISKLKDPRFKLVISHESGDEGDDYMQAIREHAMDQGVDLRFIHTRIIDGLESNGNSVDPDKYSLWDIYPCADIVTYPSLYEGFGNAFLEAVFFKKPIIVNRYDIWIEDIEPKGFEVLSMDGFVTNELIEQIKKVMDDKNLCKRMTARNYELATSHYSYSVLSRSLRTLITNITGLERYK